MFANISYGILRFYLVFICRYLNFSDICSLMLTSKNMHETIININDIWEKNHQDYQIQLCYYDILQSVIKIYKRGKLTNHQYCNAYYFRYLIFLSKLYTDLKYWSLNYVNNNLKDIINIIYYNSIRSIRFKLPGQPKKDTIFNQIENLYTFIINNENYKNQIYIHLTSNNFIIALTDQVLNIDIITPINIITENIYHLKNNDKKVVSVTNENILYPYINEQGKKNNLNFKFIIWTLVFRSKLLVIDQLAYKNMFSFDYSSLIYKNIIDFTINQSESLEKNNPHYNMRQLIRNITLPEHYLQSYK